DLQREYLALLVEHHERLWLRESYLGAIKGNSLQPWLDNRLRQYINPLLALLRHTEDPWIARQALDLGVQYDLARYDWRDRALYRLLLDLARQFGTASCWEFYPVLDTIGSAP